MTDMTVNVQRHAMFGLATAVTTAPLATQSSASPVPSPGLAAAHDGKTPGCALSMNWTRA